MAIQDDAGYLKLAHLFTGAEVLMRTGGRQVMGTLDRALKPCQTAGLSPTAVVPMRPTHSRALPSPPARCGSRCSCPAKAG